MQQEHEARSRLRTEVLEAQVQQQGDQLAEIRAELQFLRHGMRVRLNVKQRCWKVSLSSKQLFTGELRNSVHSLSLLAASVHDDFTARNGPLFPSFKHRAISL